MREHSTIGETLEIEPGRVAWRCLWETDRCRVRGEGVSLSGATRALEQHYRTQHATEHEPWTPLPADKVPSSA